MLLKVTWLVVMLFYSPGPFIGLFINTCGCRKTAMIGGFLTSLGWVLSAFATNVHFLFFTFGLMAGECNICHLIEQPFLTF